MRSDPLRNSSHHSDLLDSATISNIGDGSVRRKDGRPVLSQYLLMKDQAVMPHPNPYPFLLLPPPMPVAWSNHPGTGG